MFYHDWRPQPKAADIAAWHALLDAVLDADDREVATFASYAERQHRLCCLG